MPFERTAIREPPALPDGAPLAKANAHHRDAIISFREHDHVYFVYHEATDTYMRVTMSVSGVYKVFSEPFHSRDVAAAVVKKRKHDRTSPYYWLIQSALEPDDDDPAIDAICDAWDKSGNKSAGLGTICHAAVEHYLNGMLENVEQALSATLALSGPLYEAARRWIDEKCEDGWKPWRTEYSIFIDGLAAVEDKDRPLLEAHAAIIAGQIDAIFTDAAGKYHMVDWKFCGKDKLDPCRGEYGGRVPRCKEPLGEVPDNQYGHYLIQQTLYAFILKKRYGIKLDTMRLLHVATDTSEEIVKPVEVPLKALDDDLVVHILERACGRNE